MDPHDKKPKDCPGKLNPGAYICTECWGRNGKCLADSKAQLTNSRIDHYYPQGKDEKD